MIYYDREGNSITGKKHAELSHNPKYTSIKCTALPDGTVISTIWYGHVHSQGPNGPMIFETMVLRPGQEGWEEQYRYSTEEEASRHHDELVSLEYHANKYDANTRWNQIGDDVE